MGKKLKFPFLSKSTESTTTTTATTTAWPWPTCTNNPKTLSFRAPIDENIYKTMNSAYHDETPSFNNTHKEDMSINPIDESDVIFESLKSERLFFEPGETSSILEEAKANNFPYKESATIMGMDSNDPFIDFRVSMEEMVEAHGLKDWDCLEELLSCYLKVNGKKNHGYIVEAFVDLLLHFAFVDSVSSAIDEHCSASSSSTRTTTTTTTTTTQFSFTSPLSFSSTTNSSTSPCQSHSEEKNADVCSSSKSSTPGV